MNVVLDTNVLLSALWSRDPYAPDILQAVFSGKLTACYDYRILEEYNRVLHYKKCSFSDSEINAVLGPIEKEGLSVIADPMRGVPFADEADRKFFEVSIFCNAVLITGNKRHFPDEPAILEASEFCRKCL